MTFKNGNMLNEKLGILCHQVNCQYVMGAGIALQIKNMYPEHYEDYQKASLLLGKVIKTKVNNNLYICGICGQDDCGNRKCFTNYNALERGFVDVAALSKETKLPVFVPYRIGCGLAGGDWNIVQDILKRTVSDVHVVKYIQ